MLRRICRCPACGYCNLNLAAGSPDWLELVRDARYRALTNDSRRRAGRMPDAIKILDERSQRIRDDYVRDVVVFERYLTNLADADSHTLAEADDFCGSLRSLAKSS